MILHPGFRQAILDDREDNDTRLIYADWLDENGWPVLASIIRRQIQGLDIGYLMRNDEVHRFFQTKIDPLFKGLHPERTTYSFCRGLIGGVSLTQQDWLLTAPTLTTHCPIEEVTLWDYIGLQAITCLPETYRLKRLFVSRASSAIFNLYTDDDTWWRDVKSVAASLQQAGVEVKVIPGGIKSRGLVNNPRVGV